MKAVFSPNLKLRRRYEVLFSFIFFLSLLIGIVSLLMLLLNIINNCFGFVVIAYETNPSELLGAGSPADLTAAEWDTLLKEQISTGLYRRLNAEKKISTRSREELAALAKAYIFKPQVKKAWNLWDSLFSGREIRQFRDTMGPGATLEFRSWITPDFIVKPQSSVPEQSGIRTAILGSLWMVVITILVAFPMGIATAVYLEEYAKDTFLNRLIQVNIYNLAGIPSIIYGLFGLTIFVRFLEPLTSGALFGIQGNTTANGRTVLSAGLTLALLILPIIIINAQEAIKAVPLTLRYSSYGLGATKWQTIRHHVLPNSMDRILTGTILAVSRAIGETAPLVVIGASTFITFDPVNIFSKFTALPIQIYQWTARPQATFRNIAAAAILILLVLLLSINGVAIVMRNRMTAKRSDY